jgi:Tfp pilus assembly protein PilN
MSTPEVSRGGLAIVAGFIVLVALIGGAWYWVSSEISRLERKQIELKAEAARLQVLKLEIDKYEKDKRLLEGRIEIIEKLKENQSGPLLLINNVIQSMPADGTLWLTLVDQKGDRVQIKGLSVRSEAIPDFMSSLGRTGYFKTVDLELLEDDKDTARFSLLCITSRKSVTE